MQGIQIASLVFIFIMLYVVRIHAQKKELPLPESYFWTGVLLIMGTLVIVPSTADFIRHLFSVTRLLDVIMIVSFMGTFILLIENRIQLGKLKNQLEKIVRSQAIKSK